MARRKTRRATPDDEPILQPQRPYTPEEIARLEAGIESARSAPGRAMMQMLEFAETIEDVARVEETLTRYERESVSPPSYVPQVKAELSRVKKRIEAALHEGRA